MWQGFTDEKQLSPLDEAGFRSRPAEETTAAAVADGMQTMLADGFRKAAAGLTPPGEVMVVVSRPIERKN